MKQQILEASMELLKTDPMGWSTTVVGKMAGCTQPLIHYHFGSKQQLLWESWLSLTNGMGRDALSECLFAAIENTCTPTGLVKLFDSLRHVTVNDEVLGR